MVPTVSRLRNRNILLTRLLPIKLLLMHLCVPLVFLICSSCVISYREKHNKCDDKEDQSDVEIMTIRETAAVFGMVVKTKNKRKQV